MKKALFPVLFLALACGDGNPIQPDDAPSVTTDQPTLAVSREPGANPKWDLTATATFVRQVDPAEMRINPAGMMFGTGLINEFAVSGELAGQPIEGLWYFIGDYRLNSNNGKGLSQARPVLWVITSSALGEGAFECVGTFKIEHFFTGIIQYGTVTGCHGSGAFEGMKLNSYVTNEANPGSFVYAFWGEIW
jgi:hypothetical protein